MSILIKGIDRLIWHSVEQLLPNADEIPYNTMVGPSQGEKRREVSDRVLAIDKNGLMLTGYFVTTGLRHTYYGPAKRTKYDHAGLGFWEFLDHYQNDPNQWLCPVSNFEPIAWALLSVKPTMIEAEE